MVSKHNGECPIYINYMDIDKAIPKKLFQLPRIDQVIDAVSGHTVLCFLDAYKGYHEIQMAVEDMERTSFVTNDGIFCYTRMPFGLKNAGAKF